MSKELQAQSETFAEDVLQYLIAIGRADHGRSYFGTLSCGNPNLVKRLEAGKLPSLEVMIKVRLFMECNPPLENGEEPKLRPVLAGDRCAEVGS